MLLDSANFKDILVLFVVVLFGEVLSAICESAEVVLWDFVYAVATSDECGVYENSSLLDKSVCPTKRRGVGQTAAYSTVL